MAFHSASLVTVAFLLAISQDQRQGTIDHVGDRLVYNGVVNLDGFERLGALANSQIDGAFITANKINPKTRQRGPRVLSPQVKIQITMFLSFQG
ncbi:hypothetical protein IW261DRAFT_1508590 [Armillaria novae-zelandiae]|uniref:Uncharacterized protein n=1 Tax=Armillaria novae-zelandiae TaxID=153914 RepID=A0AA39NUQ4_9AGAR|nr:hypothetical protein IW261DRAFT_1508590 [Armillaria novae-zelandiae]